MRSGILLLTTLFLLISHAFAADDKKDGETKDKALSILQAKCNVCHIRQNPFRVFSRNNMNRNAANIYEQVFVKGRMPRGNEISLSEEERQTLKSWLVAQHVPK